MEHIIKQIIAKYDDPDREGLAGTPERYIKFMDEFMNPAPYKFTTFDSEGYDEMISICNIPFFSLCEHHLAPFFGVAHVAYIPSTRIVGLSKIPRTVDFFSRRFQNQERLTKQILSEIENNLSPRGVAVMIKARHLCIEMRGIKKHNCETTTTQLTGVFKSDEKARAEFLNLVK